VDDTVKDYARRREAAQDLERVARDLRLVFMEDSGRIPARTLEGDAGFKAALAAVLGARDLLAGELTSRAERSEGVMGCWQRALSLAEQLERWRSGVDEERVKWVELFGRALRLHSTPLSIAEIFRRQIDGDTREWIFPSATLSVNRDFSHYCSQMGLADARTASWDSPFDFANQGLLYVPQGLPDPNTPQTTEAGTRAALPLIEA